ncbi:MAG: LysR family transcriptional regulator, partial [Ottowia sp.]|nr:LysR family transcriptional regulator [Ottowia sp.]
AQALLDAAAQVQDLLADGGLSMRLGASTTIANYLLPPRLAAFRTAYPAARVQLTVGNTGEVVAAVAAMELDFGLIEGACHHPDLAVSDWQQDELVIIAPPGHALTRGRATRAALAGAAWLLREPGSGTREEVERWLHTHVGPVRMDMELGNSEAIRRA